MTAKSGTVVKTGTARMGKSASLAQAGLGTAIAASTRAWKVSWAPATTPLSTGSRSRVAPSRPDSDAYCGDAAGTGCAPCLHRERGPARSLPGPHDLGAHQRQRRPVHADLSGPPGRHRRASETRRRAGLHRDLPRGSLDSSSPRAIVSSRRRSTGWCSIRPATSARCRPRSQSAIHIPSSTSCCSAFRPAPRCRRCTLELIHLWESSTPGDWLGNTVTLAGFGDTADGSDGRLQFLDEPVVSVDANEIVVDGGAEHGACAGGSGWAAPGDVRRGRAPRLIGV